MAHMNRELFELYYNKSLEVRWNARRVRIDVPVDVFSSYHIDLGTRFLLKEITARRPKWNRALDLGCGYGPISLYLSASEIAERIDAIDRDAVSIAFTEHNAAANNLENISVNGGIAYSGVADTSYDAIVSNIPAKVGHPVHELILLGAYNHLEEDGEVWIVVVRPLEESINTILSRPQVEVLHKIVKKDHAVYNFSFSGEPEVPAGAYIRGTKLFHWRGWPYEITSFHGLAEFDERSHSTDLATQVIEKLSAERDFARVLVGNCGQGHIPVLLGHRMKSLQRMCLASRDLIALEAGKHNLHQHGFAGETLFAHTPLLRSPGENFSPDLIVVPLREREGYDVHLGKVSQTLAEHPRCPLVLGCSSGKGARLEKALRKLGCRVSLKAKRKGFCAFTVSRADL